VVPPTDTADASAILGNRVLPTRGQRTRQRLLDAGDHQH
jgi:hypothetical protein